MFQTFKQINANQTKLAFNKTGEHGLYMQNMGKFRKKDTPKLDT